MIQRLLAEDNALNPGKIYAWAEYRVFRREFQARFPDASPKACINAFCKLFLKNDICWMLINLYHCTGLVCIQDISDIFNRDFP